MQRGGGGPHLAKGALGAAHVCDGRGSQCTPVAAASAVLLPPQLLRREARRHLLQLGRQVRKGALPVRRGGEGVRTALEAAGPSPTSLPPRTLKTRQSSGGGASACAAIVAAMAAMDWLPRARPLGDPGPPPPPPEEPSEMKRGFICVESTPTLTRVAASLERGCKEERGQGSSCRGRRVPRAASVLCCSSC